ncbi:hypothetical protein QBC47DRAFT_373526 [Echria macrotheca]|uniref:Meiotically up-regulated gene 190 protein n=1 Tax=Echria macrotheca TaxID=438768 RepID=A0AAJ0FEB5_9PEZI|nr:hypothetical protein QBC47DRAFT_373526 [Echria macrotheca]
MDDFEERGPRRAHGGPYTSKHPVPTVRRYREHRAEIKQREDESNDNPEYQDDDQDAQEQDQSKTKRAFESIKTIAKDQDKPRGDLYPAANRNASGPPDSSQNSLNDPGRGDDDDGHDTQDEKSGGKDQKKSKDKAKSATETVAGSIDPKEKRKTMKKAKRHGGGREVTDPVTHLPVIVHDMTEKDLKASPENVPGVDEEPRSWTGIKCGSKSQEQLDQEKDELRRGLNGMRKLFPPPNFDDTKLEMMATFRTGMLAGLTTICGFVVVVGLVVTMKMRQDSGKGWFGSSTATHNSWPWMTILAALSAIVAVGFAVVHTTSGWLSKKVDQIFEEETWDAARQQEISRNDLDIELPESVAWLNSLLASIWRLINPDLFASITDTLEDVMQASLPKVIRMVSVDDIGQGSEAFRILGIRWLPTGAAGQSVDSQGSLKPVKDNDRTVSEQGQDADAEGDDKQNDGQGEQENQQIREGMEAEEGDFVNMELAFAYRARSSGKSIKSKAKNAHLYLKFYLPGGIPVPVWVELRGIVGIMRLRLQLTPDPPFFQLCTLTFLGQPKADLSCVPLSKHSLNVMNVPLISSFVQSSIDAALAEYVAPKSLTLDLKDMLMGDDFKKDTMARGVVLVHIKKARGFKEGDGSLGPIKGSSDSYVSVSWGKFGKPVFSTRIIVDSQEPNWNEWAMVLVTPDEINADESLRLQLWDSDKYTADDDLGRVEIDIKRLIHSPETQNKMCDREDPLQGEDPDESMPGTMTWSVGFFSKAHIQQCQLDKQTFDPSIRSPEAMKERVARDARSKLREAISSRDVSDELRQQEAQDLKELESSLTISAPPPEGFPSGILGIQIHNITGLEVAKLNRDRSGGDDGHREDEAEQSDDLPDSYCTVILNHRKIYRTRTKPKNAKPFFNAGTERFVRDWRTAEVIVSVRDAREGENDPLLGVVYLPLRRVFDKRSQVMATYPLAGGIGYGRARVSLVWRSVELKLPKELTGWDYGTLEVKGPVRSVGTLPDELKGCKLKLKTKIGKAKMRAAEGEDGVWVPKHRKDEDGVFLGVIKRYATALVVEFRNSSVVSEHNPALAVLWLGEIPDEEEKTVRLKVWKGGKKQLQRARSCADYHGLEEGEQPLGEIEMTVRLWRGLSGYHKSYADNSKNRELKGVMEVLDTVNDEKMAEDEEDSLASWDSASDSSESESGSDDDSDASSDFHSGGIKKRDSQAEAEKRKMLRKAGEGSSSDSDSDSGEGKKGPISKIKERASTLLEGKSGDDDDGKRGPLEQIQDYKRHSKRLHRKHRGVMQWKATRTLDWMVDRVKDGKGKVGSKLRHGDKDQGIETEV